MLWLQMSSGAARWINLRHMRRETQSWAITIVSVSCVDFPRSILELAKVLYVAALCFIWLPLAITVDKLLLGQPAIDLLFSLARERG